MMTVRLETLFLIFKVLSYGLAEESPCTPGFESKMLVFKVHKDHLHRGERLGRVIFNTCDGRTGIDFQSSDQGIDLNMDGTLMMRRSVTLHEGLKKFSVSAWDSSGKKHTASVRVERVHYHEDHDVNTLMNNSSVQVESPSDDLVLTFPKSSAGLRRAKRGWIIPPISISENSRGPFPMRLVKIRSDYASETRMAYKITGEGADLDPKGIFQIDRQSGWISVTQKLDREQKASYKLVAHATGVDVNIVQKPMEIFVIVTDQNDNKPAFTQDPFNGNVPEAAGKGEVFMTVTATDADDEENTDNADISYAIISQDPPSPKPNMFAINPVSGGISVLETGLDREQWSSYTLVITAADMKGEGLSTTATAVITVTDSNDKTPKLGRGWIIPPVNVAENSKGPFPVRLVQVRSDYASKTRMAYQITGEGADLDPKGIFHIDRLSGWISVTQPLDREKKDSYKIVAHATGVDVNIKEKPMEIVVTVTDQNDNKPVFTQNPFNGNVPEATGKGEVFMTVTATDADDKENTDNADISYSIINQDPPSPKPNMFAINTVSGGISVIETGLDREQWSSYTLVIKAADMKGEGLSTTATAVITVTDPAV